MGEAVALARALALRPARRSDASAIAAIWNWEVRFTEATTDTEPRTLAAQRAWLAARGDDHPVVVAVRRGEVLGFGALSPYRSTAAFARTVEDSVYVRRDARGQGVGAVILGRLVDLARERRHRSVIARVTASNDASLALHASLGFERVGLERQTAFKLGRWLDVVTMQALLATPPRPE